MARKRTTKNSISRRIDQWIEEFESAVRDADTAGEMVGSNKEQAKIDLELNRARAQFSQRLLRMAQALKRQPNAGNH